MNHFFLEMHSKEKLNAMRREGLTSQQLRRSGARRNDFAHGMPRLIGITIFFLGVLGLILH